MCSVFTGLYGTKAEMAVETSAVSPEPGGIRERNETALLVTVATTLIYIFRLSHKNR